MRTFILLISFFYGILVFGQTLSVAQKQQFTDRHNYWRKQASAPDMVWSDKIAADAQKWADLLAKQCGVLKHSGNRSYGENIYYGSDIDPNKVVDFWAAENVKYNGEPIKPSGNYLHYTQIIWKKTTEVGCAISKCSNGNYYCVCNYSLPGNIIGQKP